MHSSADLEGVGNLRKNRLEWYREFQTSCSSTCSRAGSPPTPATNSPRAQNPGIVTANPTNLTEVSDVVAKAVTFRRIYRSTSSDPAVIIRRNTPSKSANGLMRYSDGSTVSYDFGVDGKEYKGAYSRTVTWSAADEISRACSAARGGSEDRLETRRIFS